MDAYEILEVEETTSFVEIKNSYRALRSKHHPDKGGDAIKFAEILSAYEWILENPYVKPSYKEPVYTKPFVSSMDDSFIYRYMDSFRDPSESVIIPKAYDESVELGFAGYLLDGSLCYKISLEQAYNGGKLNLVIPNYDTGKYDLPALTEDNTQIKVRLKGVVSWLSGEEQVVKINLRIAQHDLYSIEKGNLFATVKMSLSEMLTGDPVRLPHPDGKNLLTVPIPLNYSIGDSIRIPNLGFRILEYGIKDYGSIFLTVLVKLPKLGEDELKNIQRILDEI